MSGCDELAGLRAENESLRKTVDSLMTRVERDFAAAASGHEMFVGSLQFQRALQRRTSHLEQVNESVRKEVRERRRMEEQIRRERRLLENIIANIPHFVFWKDKWLVYQGCNQAFARRAGVDRPDRIVGKTDYDLPWARHEAECYRSDEAAVIASGEARLSIEETQQCADGSQTWLLTSKVPLRNDAGEVAGVLGIFADITERKQLEAQLAQAQKLESIGQLAAGIAHEINTPAQYVGDNVRFIQDAFADLIRLVGALRSSLGAGDGSSGEHPATVRALTSELDIEFLEEEVPRAIDESLEGLERISRIVLAMKDFSHPGRDGMEPADLNRAIESTVTICRNRWKYVSEVVLDLDDRLPPVPCFVGDFNQLVLNLVVNAADAIGESIGAEGTDKGLITVSTCRVGHQVELRVSDNGPGIPADVINRIFDPFFTTKPVGKGTGQGLSICRDVAVKRHAGDIRVESEPGAGTSVIVRIPLEQEPECAGAGKEAA